MTVYARYLKFINAYAEATLGRSVYVHWFSGFV